MRLRRASHTRFSGPGGTGLKVLFAITAALAVSCGAEPDPATKEVGQAVVDSTAVRHWQGASPNLEPADADAVEEWTALVEASLAQSTGTPGVWIAVSHPERGFWSAALGEAVAGARPATLDDHGRIGSITKTFTAVAVLEQVDAGTLDLDDRVAGLVPDLAARFPEIADLTIEQLLSMSSGLGDYANVPGAATALAVADPTRVWTPEDLIASALEASEVQPVGTPGYSTTNYTILGRILEAVTGRSVEEVVTDLAARAGLNETALLPGDQNEMPEPFTHGYIDPAGVTELAKVASTTVVAGTDVTGWSLSWGGAGGGMYATIDDLFRWTAGALGNGLLSDSLATRRLELETRIPEQGLRYGLGIFGLEGFGDWVGHTGQAIGWEAMSMYHPGSGATYAVMINSTGGLEPFLVTWIKMFGVGT